MNGNVAVSTQAKCGRAQARTAFRGSAAGEVEGKADTTIGMPDNNSLWPGDAGRQGSS